MGKLLPEFNAVNSFTRVIEAIHSIDRFRFVIASKKEKVLRILKLKC